MRLLKLCVIGIVSSIVLFVLFLIVLPALKTVFDDKKPQKNTNLIQSATNNKNDPVNLGLFSLTTQGDGKGAYIMDSLTGDAWFVVGTSRRPCVNTFSGTEIPHEEALKVTGRAGGRGNTFTGMIYNGSSWHVSYVLARIKDKNSQERIYAIREAVSPFSVGKFEIEIGNTSGEENPSWGISKVYGIPPGH